MSGDEGDYWRDVKPAMKERSAQKRANNREGSAHFLKEAGLSFESKNDGAHLIVRHYPLVIDFWPGTGLWQVRGKPFRRRGVRSLIDYARKNNTEGRKDE